MQLSLSISLKRNAFTDPNIHAAEPPAKTPADSKKSWLDDLQETEREKVMRERKKALNILFDKADLQPYQHDSALPTGSQSKRIMLDRMEKRTGVGDEDEEDEMSEIQLNLVCAFACFVALSPDLMSKSTCRFESDQERREPARARPAGHFRAEPAAMSVQTRGHIGRTLLTSLYAFQTRSRRSVGWRRWRQGKSRLARACRCILCGRSTSFQAPLRQPIASTTIRTLVRPNGPLYDGTAETEVSSLQARSRSISRRPRQGAEEAFLPTRWDLERRSWSPPCEQPFFRP